MRGAMPGFAGVFTRAELVALAARDDVESRLVVRNRGGWNLEHGPFRRAQFKTLPATGWTLLVQGTNLHSDAADALLRRFAFIPYARLDDLMVSYAAPGGGVGPHFDSYDVFLLQGDGSPPLAIRPPGRPVVAAGPAGQDPAPLHADARRDARARRHAVPAALLRARRRRGGSVHRPIRSASAPRRTTRSRRRSSTICAMASALEGRYGDAGLKPSGEPARIGKRDAAARRGAVAGNHAGIAPRRRASSARSCPIPSPTSTSSLRRRRFRARRLRRPSPNAAWRSTGARNGSTMTMRFTSTARPTHGPTATAQPLTELANARALAARDAASLRARRTPIPPRRIHAMDSSTSPEAATRPLPAKSVSTRSPRRPRRSTS